VARILKSEWGELSPALLASIFPCDRDGTQLAGADVVVSPPTEASIELSANWHSPFENMGPESKAPALMAMLQTGMLTNAFMALTGASAALLGSDKVAGNYAGVRDALTRGADWVDQQFSDAAEDVFGMTGMTKLNATQVYTGSAPVKISLSLLFRAFRNTQAEVQDPIDALASWQLPLNLSVEGSITGAIRGLSTGQGLLKSVFPSRAPRFVGLRFAGYLFSPLVIESLSMPLTGPMTRDAGALQRQVQLSLASTTALDADDWRRARNGQPVRMYETRKR